LPKKEALQAIRWQLKDELGANYDNVLIEWRIAKEYADADGASKQEVVFAWLKNTDKYLSISRQCNLLPLGITTAFFNYASVLKCYTENLSVEAVLDIGAADSAICIYINNRPAFSRRLVFSTEKITQSLTDTLLTVKGPVKLSYEQAEEVRDKFGLPLDESAVLENNLAAIHVISLLRPSLESLVRELKYSFDYFTLNYKEERPAILYLTGGGANLKNLDAYLNKELNLKISYLSLPPCIDTTAIPQQALEKDKKQLVNALGAVLAGPESVNFLPLEARMQRIEPIEKGFLRLVAFAAVAFLTVSYYLLNFQLRFYKKRLDNSAIILQKVGQLNAAIEKLSPLEDIVYEIKKHSLPAEGLLKLLSNVLPADVILDELFLDEKTNSLNLKGTVVKDPASLAKAVEELNRSAFFKKAVLVSSKKEAGVQSFEITCELIY
ncbi:MAG: pilus assembly protein PilM, partial [Candidatus Omnitrophica bacterium]|nr:pilus assembly protein PilM [Candidatus Omnitrophota bacterium]